MLEKELSKLPDTIEYCDIVDIVNSSFAEDAVLKIELPQKDTNTGLSITYTEENSRVANLYIGKDSDHKTYISHIYPFLYQKKYAGFDRMTRISLDGNTAEVFSDRVVAGKDIDYVSKKPILISEPSTKIQGQDERVFDILNRTELYLQLIFALVELPQYYKNQITTFRGKIFKGENVNRYVHVLEKVGKLRTGEMKLTKTNWKEIAPVYRPRLDHPPYVVFNS